MGFFRSDKLHLRLLVGNKTHTPTIEWCVIDLDTQRKRKSVKALRGPDSIADEGLVLAWLYPEYIQDIKRKENPGFFLAGYELNVPEDGGYDGPWYRVPLVEQDDVSFEVCLHARWHCVTDSDYPVPVCRE